MRVAREKSHATHDMCRRQLAGTCRAGDVRRQEACGPTGSPARLPARLKLSEQPCPGTGVPMASPNKPNRRGKNINPRSRRTRKTATPLPVERNGGPPTTQPSARASLPAPRAQRPRTVPREHASQGPAQSTLLPPPRDRQVLRECAAVQESPPPGPGTAARGPPAQRTLGGCRSGRRAVPRGVHRSTPRSGTARRGR
jgi:hypothetical protein